MQNTKLRNVEIDVFNKKRNIKYFYEVNVSPNEDAVWLSKDDMSILFQRDRSVISRHIANIYKEGELEEKSTRAKNAHVTSFKILKNGLKKLPQ